MSATVTPETGPTPTPAPGLAPAAAARRARLSLLARAAPARLAALWSAWSGDAGEPAHVILRPAEIGTVMVRGRAGAIGAPFNLGEMTVTRCALRLAEGSVGHGTIQGRDRDAARRVALIDALFEAAQGDDARGAALDAAFLAPLRDATAARGQARAEKAAATRVQFFTLVRGDV